MCIKIFLILATSVLSDCKKAKPINQTRPAAKYDNPNFIRDRYHDEIWKPMMHEAWANRFKKPFNPAWMDYCDPYHCNDYHKLACGLNRKKMKFKWFQSNCHIILHNLCSRYRGALEYDVVETKFCAAYVMFSRSGCPSVCPNIPYPICAVSSIKNGAVIFKNYCFLERANCRGLLEEYEAVDMKICGVLIQSK